MDGPGINHNLFLVKLVSPREDVVLASHYLDQAAGLDPTHPHLAAVKTNLSARQAALANSPYRFEPSWP